MDYKNVVYIQALYELVVLGKKVEPRHLAAACQGVYLSIKIVGIEKTTFYYKVNEEDVYLTHKNIPIRVLAVAAIGAKMIYRFEDNSGRLESHYGLPTTAANILMDIEIFKDINGILPIISFIDVVDAFVKN